jgi:hypothetical protein
MLRKSSMTRQSSLLRKSSMTWASSMTKESREEYPLMYFVVSVYQDSDSV